LPAPKRSVEFYEETDSGKRNRTTSLDRKRRSGVFPE